MSRTRPKRAPAHATKAATRLRHGAAAPPVAPEAPSADRAALVLWVCLAVLLAVRIVASLSGGMGLWGFNLQRFLPPVAWILWVAAAAALVPGVGRTLEPAARRIGEALGAGRAWPALAGTAIVVGLVLALPDRVRFVGDFLIRQGTVEESVLPSTLFPQALPLDTLLHYHLPRWLADAGLADANGAARILGVIEAAVLAWVAARFPRALGLRGAAALACAAAVALGGTLGMFAGFGKAFAELVLVSALLGFFGVRAVREGRGLLGLGVTLAAAVTLHRSALGFVPAVLLVWVLWWRAHAGESPWRRRDVWLGALIPLATLAIMLPRIVAIVRRWDPVHFTPYQVTSQGALQAAFAGGRPLDMLSLIAVLSPLALVIPPVWLALGPAPLKRREPWVLVAIALPMLLAMPFIHPAQGMFRDWDDFASLGAALSMLAAWTVGEVLRAAPRRAWLAVAVVASAAAPAIAWLAVQADVERGLARVEALMTEPPPRTEQERATTFDFLGGRYQGIGRYADAARAYRQAAEVAPSPRILLAWGMMETAAGHLAEARGAYERLLAKDSVTVTPWLGLATVATRSRDFAAGERAALRALAIDSTNATAIEILSYIEQQRRAPALPPGSRPRGR
jgi:hypothetical protein